MIGEKNKDKKGLVISCFLVLLLIIFVFGISYAIFQYSKAGQVKNTITSGSIIFNYVETTNGISLENAMPISDDAGKLLEGDNKNGFFDFNVSCKIVGTSVINYEIYAVKQAVEDAIEDKYVKIYLTDGVSDTPITGYDVDIPTFDTLRESSVNKDYKQLYYGTFNSTGTQKFRLRMWVSEKYLVPTSSKQFKLKVNVIARDR